MLLKIKTNEKKITLQKNIQDYKKVKKITREIKNKI